MHVFASAVQARLKLPKSIGFRFSVYGIHTEASEPLHARAPVGRPQHLISTLDPSRLTSRDYIDLSRREFFTIRFPTSYGTQKGQLRYQSDGPYRQIAFPPQSTGFLYYHRDPDGAPLEGSIRFRITSDNSPSSFIHGHDLRMPSGRLWQIILFQVVCAVQYVRLRKHLLAENLVTEDQTALCARLCASIDRRKIYADGTLFRLTQEFEVHFTSDISLTIVGETLQSLRWRLFRAKHDGKNIPVWSGSALARFEPSTNPEHAGRRVVCLRFVKISTPISCRVKRYKGRIVKPEEGQLLTLCLRGGAPAPWSYDIDANDTAPASALRALWDSSGPRTM
ncbi:hypothetical protein B0H12DRAFT_1074841 [Mycena haematopus]|nr:hypothetical protein B0H12DRAFT_1074841 [Mycena haematopus]